MSGARRFLGSRDVRRCRRCARARSEGGFALVEVLIAFSVLFIALTGLGLEMATQYSSVGSSKYEQTGEGLLARALAQVRALPYTVVAKGLSKSDLKGTATATCTAQTATSYIKTTATTWTFKDSALSGGSGTGEALLHYVPVTATPPAPFYPHRSCTKVNNVKYTVLTFPTKYSTASTGSPTHWISRELRVTVMVSWQGTGQGGPTSLVGQTLVYPKTIACTTLAALTHANTAACQPDFTATTETGDGTLAVKPVSGNPIQTLSFTDFELLLPGVSSQETLTETSAVDGAAQASEVETSPTTTLDQVKRVTSKSTNDLASGTSNYQSQSFTSSTSAVTLTGSTHAYSITGTPSSGDTGTSVSTTSATATRACVNLTTTKQTTSLPCGSGRATQKTTATITAQFGAVGTAKLASVAKTATRNDRVLTARYSKGAVSGCPATSKSGCINAAAKGALGTIRLAGLPTKVTAPSGWTSYFVQLSGFHAKATAWARSASTFLSGTMTTVGGTLRYYTGTAKAYKTVSVTTSSQTPAIPKLVITSATLTVTITAHLVVGASTCTTTTTTTHLYVVHSKQCSVSPLSGSITYTITKGATTVANFTLTVSLGVVSATASYEVAS